MSALPSKTSSAALLLIAAVASSSAVAADWVTLSSTELGRTGDLVPTGFAQLLLEAQPWSASVTGLVAPGLQPFDGQHLAAELVEPSLTVRRARLGARGALPLTLGGTDRPLNVFVAVEAGQNALTRDAGVVLVDASLTASLLPGLRVRVGQFKLPTADEAMEHNPTQAVTTRFSPFVTALLLEQDVVEGAIVGPAAAFRDVGVQAFDALPLWRGADGGLLELTYAAMLSLGRPAHAIAHLAAARDQLEHVVAAGPDATGRLQLSYVFNDKQRFKAGRDEASVWLWRNQGQRLIDDVFDERLRQGGGAQLRLGGVRVRAEAVWADGALLAQGAFAGQPAVVVVDGRAYGGSVDLQLARLGRLSLAPFTIDTSLDWLARNPDDAEASRFLQAVTIGGTATLSSTFRLLVNAELRRQVPGALAPKDATTIADALSPVLSTQLNLVF